MLPGNELRLHTTRLVKTTDGLRGYLRVSENCSVHAHPFVGLGGLGRLVKAF